LQVATQFFLAIHGKKKQLQKDSTLTPPQKVPLQCSRQVFRLARIRARTVRSASCKEWQGGTRWRVVNTHGTAFTGRALQAGTVGSAIWQ